MAVNPVGKENNIGFLNIDWGNLDKEIKQQRRDTEAKRSCHSSGPMNMAKQTSGTLHKQQAQTKMGFLEDGYVPEPTRKQEQPIIPEAAKKLSNKFEGDNLKSLTNQSIFSARTGDISDIGGPKQVQSNATNSIWDSDNIRRLAEKNKRTSKEITQDERARLAANRNLAQDQRMNDLADNLKATDLRKDSGVNAIPSEAASSAYKSVKQHMSIFDTDDFQRLAEKTAGEKLSERKNVERNRVDDSWRNNGKSTSSKEVMNKLFDNLMGNE